MKKTLLAILLFFPTTSFAQQLLAPLPGMSNVQNLGDYLVALFNLGIGIAGVLAVVMLVICGIKLMTTESISSKGDAKSCITNALLGLIIALASFLILNTLNPELLKSDLTVKLSAPSSTQADAKGKFGPTTQAAPSTPGFWIKTIDQAGNVRYMSASTQPMCLEMVKSIMSADTGLTVDSGPNSPGVCWEIQKSPASANEQESRQNLCGNTDCVPSGPNKTNPAVNNPACTGTRKTGCTNMASMPGDTIDFIKSLVGACNDCQIVVTGGTEPGHQTHGPGQPVFDLRLVQGDALWNLILGQGTNGNGENKPVRACASASPFCGNMRWNYNGYWFVDEKSATTRHWHVCKEGASGKNGPYAFCAPPPAK